MKCYNCPRTCGIDRAQTVGVCRVKETLRLAKVSVHTFEEPCISGTRGSGTIFFSGCNLSCVFCQNASISHDAYGKDISTERFIEILQEVDESEVHNINLVSPTQYSRQIIDALRVYRPHKPVVYNCNGYENLELIEELSTVVDVFLVDFKYFSDELAFRYSGVKDYFRVASEAISKMIACKGAFQLSENGLMTSGVLIRHLVLPSHVRDSIAVLRYIKENYNGYAISVMFQYTPYRDTPSFPQLQRKLTPLECKAVDNEIDRLDFAFGYRQEVSAAEQMYTPIFDLQGV